MTDTFDLDERFSLGLGPEEALRRLLCGEGADVAPDEPEPDS
jgi:hypothetical protein